MLRTPVLLSETLLAALVPGGLSLDSQVSGFVELEGVLRRLAHHPPGRDFPDAHLVQGS